MKTRLLLLAPLAAAVSCAPTTPATDDDVARKLSPGLHDYTSPRTADTSRITIPILRAPDLEARFGKPTYSVMADGSYIAWQKAGGDRYLEIIGTPRSGIFTTSQVDGSITLAGVSTGYFATGNETAEYTTNPVRLTAPDGRSANYFIKYGIEGASPLGPFPRLTW